VRKLIVSSLVTADGIHGDPHLWAGEYSDEEAATAWLDALTKSDAFLMGKNTYELFAQMWGDPQGPYLQRMYDMPKYVYSSTLTKADWNNTTIVSGDPVAAVRELKTQGDGDLMVYGYGRLGQSLLENGLVDELHVVVNPVVLGSGTPLFRQGKRVNLRLESVSQRGNGVATLVYVPAA